MMLKHLLISSLSLSPLCATTIYTESTDGEFNQLLSAPTSIGLLYSGANTVSGTINQNGFEDADVFSFIVSANQVLTSLVLEVTSTGRSHFFAFGEGDSFEAFADDFLVSTLISDADNGVNLLETETDGGSFEGTGFTAPLGAGVYTIWFNETDGDIVDYTATFTITQVPEPASSALLALGSMALLIRRQRA
ncbi:MAG: PEP-CTERM sorting domain-containing protein [Akkermansiaceae bacterium]